MQTNTSLFALTVTGPVLLLLAIGYVLYRLKLIDKAFVASGSRLVFNVALPALLFLSISQADFSVATDPRLLATAVLTTILYFVILMFAARLLVSPVDARGVVIQGGFRANMGIIGLAYCDNLYGQEGLGIAAVILGCITLLYNVLSVFVLNFYMPGKRSASQHVTGIVTNPLIIAILLALPISYYQVDLPEVVSRTGHYFAQLTLPLALLCTGASLEFRSLGGDMRNILTSTISKCFVYPLAVTGICYAMGFRDMTLGVVYLLTVAPTAAASYVMAKSLGGDARLAASIIVVTTVLSLPLTIVGFGFLQYINAL